MRSICAVAALLVVAAPTVGLRANDTPPTDLHYIDGHWTAWNPPRDLAPGTTMHTVVHGDTLWDLAAANLGNPYLWPQIWEKNQYVLDAHWIYPGDPIVLGVSVETLDSTEIIGGTGPNGGSTRTGAGSRIGGTIDPAGTAVAGIGGAVVGPGGGPGGGAPGMPAGGFASSAAMESGVSAGLPGEDGAMGGAAAPGLDAERGGAAVTADSLDGLDIESSTDAPGPPQAFGYESDLYCSGYIGELDEALPITIAGSEHQAYGPSLAGRADPSVAVGQWGDLDTTKYGLDIGDIVYLDGGRSEGLAPGDLLSVVAPGDKVRHPLSRDTIGRLYTHLGRVRVLTVDVETAIGEIAHACDPIPVGAHLSTFRPEPVPLGRRTTPRPPNDPAPAAVLESAPVIVMARDGIVSLGEDHLVFIDRGAETDTTPGDVYTIYRLNREGFPPVPIGELAVLSVARRTSLARILSSRLPIFIGDRLERK